MKMNPVYLFFLHVQLKHLAPIACLGRVAGTKRGTKNILELPDVSFDLVSASVGIQKVLGLVKLWIKIGHKPKTVGKQIVRISSYQRTRPGPAHGPASDSSRNTWPRPRP